MVSLSWLIFFFLSLFSPYEMWLDTYGCLLCQNRFNVLVCHFNLEGNYFVSISK